VTGRRLVVVGADAAGMSAAHQALRQSRAGGQELEVIALESTTHTSYSACGIPYWMAGDVDTMDDLVARTPAQHRAMGIDLRLRSEAVALDLHAGEVIVRDSAEARTYALGFDELVLATGAEPLVPPWAADLPGVLPIKTLDDGAAWRALLADEPRSAVVVGGGFIGLEAAETFARRGISTTLVTRGSEPMSSSLEPHMSALVREALEKLGVTVVTGSEVGGIGCEGAGSKVRVACVGGTEYAADVAAIGIGVRARVDLAVDAGLSVGEHGGLRPDDRQQITDGVWAAGDCCEVYDRLLESHWFVPLGTHANKMGRTAGTNLGGGSATFPGIVGTAITRAGDAEVARTGVLRAWLPQMGLTDDAVAVTTLQSTTASGYMPEADPITVWVMAERSTGRLLACQLVGGRGAGKRIDTAATALWAGLDVGEVAMLDLAYAPPFSPVWDPVQIACRKLADQL
jgi:NADPH-dependent 2,4-dienoyl-CoA reductase/sulfur reductase-like enzyme